MKFPSADENRKIWEMECDGGPTEAPGPLTCVLMLSLRDSANGALIYTDLGGIIHSDRG